MSILDRVREKFQTPMSGTSKTSKSPSAGSAGTDDRHLKSLNPPSAGSAGSQEVSPTKTSEPGFVRSVSAAPGPVGTWEAPALTPAQEAARLDVLARLEANPDIPRAFVNRWEGDVMILTLAVRGVGTCELSIPRERFGADSVADFDALAACIMNAERPA